MFLTGMAVLAMTTQVVVVAPEDSQVAYDALLDGRNHEAIAQIDAADALEAEDPARLINLGIAYARIGDDAKARELFAAAMRSDDRARLETSNGKWIDSAHLARKAMQELETGKLRRERMASR